MTHIGALIPEIVRRGFQDLLEVVGEAFSEGVVSAAIGATHLNGYRQRLLTTQVGDISLAIP